MNSPTSPQIPAPQQKRSARSMEALLKAAEELLATRAFEDIGVAEIAKHAGSSVGSFYARFGDKQRLLHELYQRYTGRTLTIVRAGCSAFIPGRLPVPRMADIVVKTTVGFYRSNRGLLRAVLKASFADPEFARRDEAMRRGCAEALSLCLASRGHAPDVWIERIVAAMRAVKAILDHELVYRPDSSAVIGNDAGAAEAEIARLKKIFLAALDPETVLPYGPPSVSTRARLSRKAK